MAIQFTNIDLKNFMSMSSFDYDSTKLGVKLIIDPANDDPRHGAGLQMADGTFVLVYPNEVFQGNRGTRVTIIDCVHWEVRVIAWLKENEIEFQVGHVTLDHTNGTDAARFNCTKFKNVNDLIHTKLRWWDGPSA